MRSLMSIRGFSWGRGGEETILHFQARTRIGGFPSRRGPPTSTALGREAGGSRRAGQSPHLVGYASVEMRVSACLGKVASRRRRTARVRVIPRAAVGSPASYPAAFDVRAEPHHAAKAASRSASASSAWRVARRRAARTARASIRPSSNRQAPATAPSTRKVDDAVREADAEDAWAQRLGQDLRATRVDEQRGVPDRQEARRGGRVRVRAAARRGGRAGPRHPRPRARRSDARDRAPDVGDREARPVGDVARAARGRSPLR